MQLRSALPPEPREETQGDQTGLASWQQITGVPGVVGQPNVTRLLNILSLPCSACQPCCTYDPQRCDAAISPSATARCFRDCGRFEDQFHSTVLLICLMVPDLAFRAQCLPHSAKSFQTSLPLQGLRTHLPDGA